MLNWSVVPEEVLFEGFETMSCKWVEATVGGVQMLVEPIAEQPGYGRIVRLLSPDPAVYLKACYQPGQSVCMM